MVVCTLYNGHSVSANDCGGGLLRLFGVKPNTVFAFAKRGGGWTRHTCSWRACLRTLHLWQDSRTISTRRN